MTDLRAAGLDFWEGELRRRYTAMNPFEFIQNYYKVPAKIGQRITFDWHTVREGTIVGVSGPHLQVLLDGDEYPEILHPTWHVTYIEEA